MKNKLQFLLLVIVATLFMGCAVTRPSDPARLVPNYTWNWPDQGIVRDFKIDPPRSIHMFINGNYSIVDINKEPVYWLDIEEPVGRRTWVQVPLSEYVAATQDQPWKNTQGLLANK